MQARCGIVDMQQQPRGTGPIAENAVKHVHHSRTMYGTVTALDIIQHAPFTDFMAGILPSSTPFHLDPPLVVLAHLQGLPKHSRSLIFFASIHHLEGRVGKGAWGRGNEQFKPYSKSRGGSNRGMGMKQYVKWRNRKWMGRA